MLDRPLAFLDVETTGGGYQRHRIIEIGLLRVENYQVVATYQTLLNPQQSLPPEITRLTGITQAELENQPTFHQIKDDLLEYLEGAVLVAHNARFDYGFLKAEFARSEVNFTAKTLCTVHLSRRLYPRYRRHNLDALIKRFRFEVPNRHRAFDDAKVLWDFVKLARQKTKQETFQTVLKDLLKRPSLPPQIKLEIIENLPESPGVYLFYNSEDAPLYVGKSVCLKDRILSHFSGSSTSSREHRLSAEIAHIDTIPTAGDLGAQLKESQLIKDLQPIFNRKLRRLSRLVTLTQTYLDGYAAVTLNTHSDPASLDLTQPVAVFRSQQQARSQLMELAQKHRLCHKLLNIESTTTACFAHHLGDCAGACLGLEKPAAYNLRHSQAFSTLKLRQWPFAGPIAITETHLDRSDTHLFHHWRHLGTFQHSGSPISHPQPPTPNFDLDTYKILLRFLNNANNLKKISQVPTNHINREEKISAASFGPGHRPGKHYVHPLNVNSNP
jgi:DNA polymerase-3 subunit epsilon